MSRSSRDPGNAQIVERSDFEHRDRIREGPVAGVVLAAGTSARFGTENKLLAPLDGEPLIRRTVRTLRATDLSPLTVVVGHEAERVTAALAEMDLEVVSNPAFEAGQATSVRAGVERVRDRADAVLIALGDMPTVSVETVELLVDAYRSGVADALAASYDGQRGNPVLFDETFFDDLTGVTGDVGGRKLLLKSDRSALVETDDPAVLRDVDRPEDLDSLSDDR